MSEPDAPKTTPLRIASSFRASDSIYTYTHPLENPNDGHERANAMNKLRGIMKIANIKKYNLLQDDRKIALYLYTPEDITRFQIAREPADSIEQEFVQFEGGYDFRKIKRMARKLQKLSDAAGFGESIIFGASRSMRSIIIFGTPRGAYFDFADYVEANQSKFQPILDLQRAETEFDLEYPDADSARKPSIVHEEDEKTKHKPSTPERFIRGGATDETATPPRGTSLSLVKSFSETDYPFSLTPVIRIDSTRNQMDKLCQDLPDYEEFKIKTKSSWVVNNIRRTMDAAEVDDYCLYSDGGRIRAYFKDPRDLAIAYASLHPSMQHNVDYIECSHNASPMKMNKKAKKLQSIFAKAGVRIDVKFFCDMDRKVIRAQVPTTEDLILMQKISRRLERTDSGFKRLVGLN